MGFERDFEFRKRLDWREGECHFAITLIERAEFFTTAVKKLRFQRCLALSLVEGRKDLGNMLHTVFSANTACAYQLFLLRQNRDGIFRIYFARLAAFDEKLRIPRAHYVDLCIISVSDHRILEIFI